MKQFIRVDELDGGGMYYQGTFPSLGDAIVSAMEQMDEHAEQFRQDENPGSYYRLDPMICMDGGCSYSITVYYKHECWKEEVVERFIFLEGDEYNGKAEGKEKAP